MKVPLSILIPVKNEAANLPRCLNALSWADEIFVVDSQSQDQTAAIAQSFGAHVCQFQFNGTWPKKKNWALDNLPFKHDWVLILDADEILPPHAEHEIRSIVTDPDPDHAGYWVNRRFLFMGKWLKHAYYPNWNLRLFRHRLGRYEKLTDLHTASGDNEVHEHVLVRGTTGALRTEMDHYAFPSIEVFVEKHNRYSNWEARLAASQTPLSSTDSLQHSTVTTRRRLKQISRHLPFRPLLRFLYIYVWQLGFLDGREGYYFARLHAFYEFLSLTKTYEIKKMTSPTQPSQSSQPPAPLPPAKIPRILTPLFWAVLCSTLFFVLRPSPHGERVAGVPMPLKVWINQHDASSNFIAFGLLATLAFWTDSRPHPAHPGSFSSRLAASLQSRRRRLALVCALIVLLETAQLLIPGRIFDLNDIAIGWTASGLAFLAWQFLRPNLNAFRY